MIKYLYHYQFSSIDHIFWLIRDRGSQDKDFFDINNDMSETLIRFVDEMKAQSKVVLSALEE